MPARVRWDTRQRVTLARDASGRFRVLDGCPGSGGYAAIALPGNSVAEVCAVSGISAGRIWGDELAVEGEWLFHPGSPSQALALEARLREALTNISKHARAMNVTLRLQTSATHVLLEVEDDGRGFDPAGQGESTMGLTSMRERV